MSEGKLTSLSELLRGIVSIPLPSDSIISHITDDSRKVREKGMFIALAGENDDGSRYINDAIQSGAEVILTEHKLPDDAESACLIIECQDLKAKVAELLRRFYHFNPADFSLIGVTGTNGKTSIAYLLANTLGGGYIGTLGLGLPNALSATINTTPSPFVTFEALGSMQAQGISTCIMEVSSHGLVQERVKGLHFDIAVFTNLTHEHLDYHGDMATYAKAKFSLFTDTPLNHAVVNIDCEWGQALVKKIPHVSVMTYAINNQNASIKVKHFTQSLEGLKAHLSTPNGDGILESSLFCEFNLYNLLAVLGVLLIQGRPLSEALSLIKQQKTILGRMEVVRHSPTFVIDYAHTPDALQKALSNLAGLCKGKLWCVFGCGGNRDKEKRHLMGEVADSLADVIVITNDNARFEQAQDIVNDILKGVSGRARQHIELDRAKAIEYCYQHAKEEDVVLVAGKGHETYQIINGKTFHFSDHEVIKQLA
jgi:UDP-N-acetylmuramoyl-L-alanyl-D-glutamate--2,6-diaminopimelate ligase